MNRCASRITIADEHKRTQTNTNEQNDRTGRVCETTGQSLRPSVLNIRFGNKRIQTNRVRLRTGTHVGRTHNRTQTDTNEHDVFANRSVGQQNKQTNTTEYKRTRNVCEQVSDPDIVTNEHTRTHTTTVCKQFAYTKRTSDTLFCMIGCTSPLDLRSHARLNLHIALRMHWTLQSPTSNKTNIVAKGRVG